MILTAIQSSATPSGNYQFTLAAGLIFHDVSCDCAGGDGVRTCKVHLSGAAAAGEITVLGADHDLVGTRRDARAGVDAGAAARLNHNCSCSLKDVQVTLADAVFARLLRAKLNIKLAGI